MTHRVGALLATAIPLWFVVSYFLVASLRDDYRHFNMAISELGSIGAPNALLWNILGYIIPGAMITYLGWFSRKALPVSRLAQVVAGSIAASGFTMALSGVFPGDFEDRTSTSMILHSLASILSYVFYLTGGFALLSISAKSAALRFVHYPLLGLLLLSIIAGFVRYGDLPGLGQRITFACYFAWVALYGRAVFTFGDSKTTIGAA